MTKQDVIHRISRQTGIDPALGRAILDAFFDVVKSAVVQGDTVYVRTFGSFKPRQRAAKTARNITQNTAMLLEPQTKPYFKPSLEFINQVRLLKVDTQLSKEM